MSKCGISENDKSSHHEMKAIGPGRVVPLTPGGHGKKVRLLFPGLELSQGTFEL